MNTYRLFHHNKAHQVDQDVTWRVVRMSFNMPGRVTIREWVMQHCDHYGNPIGSGLGSYIVLPAACDCRTYKDVEEFLLKSDNWRVAKEILL